MTDESDFRITLNANPSDSLTWLMFADWLDDHERPLPAGVIRQVVDRTPRKCAGGWEWLCERSQWATGAGGHDGVYGPDEHSLPLAIWRSKGISFDSMGRPLRETVVFMSESSARIAMFKALLSLI